MGSSGRLQVLEGVENGNYLYNTPASQLRPVRHVRKKIVVEHSQWAVHNLDILYGPRRFAHFSTTVSPYPPVGAVVTRAKGVRHFKVKPVAEEDGSFWVQHYNNSLKHSFSLCSFQFQFLWMNSSSDMLWCCWWWRFQHLPSTSTLRYYSLRPRRAPSLELLV